MDVWNVVVVAVATLASPAPRRLGARQQCTRRMVPTSVVIAAAVVVEPYFAALPKARTDVLTRTGGRLRRTLEIRCRLCCDAAAPVVAAASAATDGDTCLLYTSDAADE